MGSFADRLEQMKKDLMKSHTDSYQRKDDKGIQYGSIFKKGKIPEGVSFWKPDKEQHIIDIIPWIAGSQHPHKKEGEATYLLDIWVYMGVGPTNEMFVAPSSNFKKADPIAEYIKREGGEAFKKNRAKRRCLYWVWVHDSAEEEEKGPQLWEVAHFFFEDPISEIALLPKGGGMQLFSMPDVKHGKQIMFNIKVSGKFKDDEGKDRDSISYTGHKFLDRAEAIPDKYVEFCMEHPIDEMVDMHPSYKNIYEAFFQKPYRNLDEDTPEDPDSGEVVESRPRERKRLAEDECPGGGKFGISVNTLPECKSCPNWEGCESELDKKKKEAYAAKEAEEEAASKSKEEEDDDDDGNEEEESKPIVKRKILKVRKRA